ncbi:MAG: MucB/RseB C-terminal domain-containing protein [Burkholderiaceae bacterium]|nr:MucB/RseB C-terminal domain-containing protein [Burkholderiaceae bacterium]
MKHLLVVSCMLIGVGAGVVPVQAAGPAPRPATQAAEPSIGDWLMRMHDASRKRSYIGTFVVSSAAGNLSSARIWHVCDGEQQMERIETLTGAPRSIFRRNDEVMTFLPEAKVVRTERRDSLGLFPNQLSAGDSSIAQFYAARRTGSERVAGFDADVVELAPKDRLRFGYRVWSEKKSGLVVKLQTLDTDGRVLEQAAFSELQLDAPVRMEKLSQMMSNTEGYKVETQELVKTTPAAEGWSLRNPVAGFKPMSCYKRPVSGTAQDNTMQWIFSDGMASVSLFVEAFDRQRHLREVMLSMGATQTLTRRIGDKPGDKDGGWWLTVVGEAPLTTLKAFAQGLERGK